MKLENISKIFGVLAFISFLLAIYEAVANYGSLKYTFIGAVIIFLLSAILTTLKRIALALERSKKK